MRAISMAIRPSAVIVVILTLLVGCVDLRRAPAYNVHHNAVFVYDEGHTLRQIEKRLVAAVNAARWIATPVRPGLLHATTRWGGGLRHVAVMNIEYNLETYSIKYGSSRYLLQKVAADGRTYVHKTYNLRVWDLEHDINRYLY